MLSSKLSGLRARLLLLVLLSVVPAFVLIFYDAMHARDSAIEDARGNVERFAQQLTSEYRILIGQSHQLLVGLSQIRLDDATLQKGRLQEPASTRSCDARLAELIKLYPRYLNIGVINTNGMLTCSALPHEKPINLADRAYFRRAVETRQFSIGNYQIGRATGKRSINVGYPISNARNELEAVIFIAIDLEWLSREWIQPKTFGVFTITLLDRSGTVFARYPEHAELIGESVDDSPLGRALLAQSGTGTAEAPGLDGVPRIYGFAPLFPGAIGEGFLTVGTAKASIIDHIDRGFRRNLALMGGVAVLVLALGWWGAGVLVLQRVNKLAAAAEKLGMGDLRARTHLPSNHDELGRLARTFDNMAENLQAKNDELQRSNRALLTLTASNQTLLRAQDESALLREMCRVVVEKGGYRGAWVGYAEHDEDRTVRVVAHHGVDERFIAQVKVSWADTNIGRGPTGTTIRTGKPTVVRDMLTDPSIVPWREEVTRLGYVSGISLPLRIRDNVVGVITLYSANLAEFGDAEIRLLTEMADDLAFGIATLRLQEEARRSEAALHAHEQRLALHVRQTPLAVIEWTPDFKVMEWNPAAEAMFGYSRAEALGRHGSFIFLPDTGREPDTVRSALKARAGHAHNVIENVAKGGEEIFCEWHNAELVDTEGNHIGATSVVQNVTDRERAQRDRARTEKRFVDLFEFSPDALVMADREGVIAAINRQAEKMFAWSRAELVGKKIEVLVPEYLRSAHVGLRGRFMQSPAVRAMGGGSANLQVQRRDGTFFPAEIGLSPMESDAGRMVIAAARDVTERKRAEETIRKLAYFDSRTGLPNRVQLRERLKEAVAKAQTQNQSLALLIPRINNFPDLQDGLGLRRAETLLQQIAQRFRAMVSGDEMLAHLGEDDFAILLPEGDARYATDVAQKMLQAMHEPFTLESLDIDVQISIGIALYPGHGTEPDALILRGDIAARQARQGGHDYAIYAGATDQESPQRLSLITELRRAIESDQLTLYYQPKVDVRTGLVCGAEALVRWQHPERGMIPPVNFIPLAEHTGLIKPLTYWVIDAATRQCAAWQKAGLKAPVAVNLSVENLRDPRLLDTIKGSFATWGLPPECLQVEITESALMSDPTKSLAVLTHLKEIGIKLFIDDFGTGYSSLGYLATLPVHALKIDRSFIIRMVNEPDHMTIVSSTISLAHSLKLKVVAEGVDAEDQAQSLRRLKCDEIQGYLYSPPLPPEKFQDWQAKFTLNVGEPKGKGSSS